MLHDDNFVTEWWSLQYCHLCGMKTYSDSG